MYNTRQTAVVYLMWMPYGISFFRSFVKSYNDFPAGISHDLVICFNGASANEDLTMYEQLLTENNIQAKFFRLDGGQDIDAYRFVARQLSAENILFLNTYSTFREHGWLKKYVNAFENPGVGLIGASASLQSYYSSVFQKNPWFWETGKSFTHNFRKYKLFVKAFFYWRFLFKPFPNPHIRTNAFFTRREHFLEHNGGPLLTKFQAYQFENGRNSLTNFFIKKGLRTLVMDKHGNTYDIAQWRNSRTFWINEQENLLVTDNQTGIYAAADTEERKTMTTLAWGKQ